MSPLAKSFVLSFLVLSSAVCPAAADDGSDKARILFENGLYTEALAAFQSLPDYGDDPEIDGYAVLCAQKRHIPGYEVMVQNYLERYPEGKLSREVRLEKAFDLFDAEDYSGALSQFVCIHPDRLRPNALAEFVFKKGYSHFKTGDGVSAKYEFSNLDHMTVNDYSAPGWFCLGYMSYCDGDFRDALRWFGKASSDERFKPISDYYSVICNYELKNYAFVLAEGVSLYDGNVPPDRKAHLARLISESYLISGNKDEALSYFGNADDGLPKSRADFFYAGSLMFATGDWAAAVDNYASIAEKTDSLGQIAWYNTALSYINMKNKVAALDAFREASALPYDSVMAEDAMFNYAKLAFDLNGDASVFSEYMKRYSDRVRGERIYSYMAVAALSGKDYQAAIDSYDKIESLEGDDRRNYVKANYLRGTELFRAGSFRKAANCFTAVSYYAQKDELVSQLADFALAESRYRDACYQDAAGKFIELYNSSALFGRPQGESLSYNAAYACLKYGDYEKASRWFGIYCADGGKLYLKDAMLRKADCIMALGRYEDAVDAYRAVRDKYFEINDIYPYYMEAVACGLSAPVKKRKDAISRKLELLDNVLSADPSSAYYADALFELGKTLAEAKQTAKAVNCFKKVVDSLPGSAFAARSLLELGTISRNAGNVEAALAAYAEVVEKMPSSTFCDDALLAIEAIYQSMNRPDSYFAYLDKIGRGSSKSEEERRLMSFSAAEQAFYSGNYAEAAEAFKKVKSDWPSSEQAGLSDWYLGECFRNTGEKIMACDAYKMVISRGRGKYYAKALDRYAQLCCSLEDFSEAYVAYDSLRVASPDAASLSVAYSGMMKSAYMDRKYVEAEAAASVVISDTSRTSSELREARMIRAKSLLSVSRRAEAMDCFRELASEPGTAEGAEASYMVIQDLFDGGDFDAVKDKVFAFSESGTSQQYWLAKAFIVLGDVFAEQGNFKQARATFQSIADGFGSSDEINGELKMRMDKLNGMDL